MKKATANIILLSDGRKLGYAEYGSPRGKPVFYFHGWPGSRLSGFETDSAARKLNIRVISPDRPGFGLSDYKKDRTLLDWPDDVVALANKLRIKKFAVMGCSGGGPYVAACAYKMPERITEAAIVVGLGPIINNKMLSGMNLQRKLGWSNYHRFSWLRTLASIGAAIQFKYIPPLGFVLAFTTKEDKAIFRSLKNDQVKEAFRQGIKGPALDLKIFTDDWGFELKDIKTKVYLWYGAKDKCVSLNMARYYKSQIPNSKLFIDPTGGHLFRYRIEEKILKTIAGS